MIGMQFYSVTQKQLLFFFINKTMQITKKLSHNHKQNIWMLKILFEIIDDM